MEKLRRFILPISLFVLLFASIFLTIHSFSLSRLVNFRDSELENLKRENKEFRKIVDGYGAINEQKKEEEEKEKTECTKEEVHEIINKDMEYLKVYPVGDNISNDDCEISVREYIGEYLVDLKTEDRYLWEYTPIQGTEILAVIISFPEGNDDLDSKSNIEVNRIDLLTGEVISIYKIKDNMQIDDISVFNGESNLSAFFRLQERTGVGCMEVEPGDCDFIEDHFNNVCNNPKSGIYYIDLETNKVEKVKSNNLCGN